MNAHNTFAAPDTVKPVSFDGTSIKGESLEAKFPAKSVVILTLK